MTSGDQVYRCLCSPSCCKHQPMRRRRGDPGGPDSHGKGVVGGRGNIWNPSWAAVQWKAVISPRVGVSVRWERAAAALEVPLVWVGICSRRVETPGGGRGLFRGFNCQLWRDEACTRTHVHTLSGLHFLTCCPFFPSWMAGKCCVCLLQTRAEVKPVGQIGQIEKQRRAVRHAGGRAKHDPPPPPR